MRIFESGSASEAYTTKMRNEAVEMSDVKVSGLLRRERFYRDVKVSDASTATMQAVTVR